VGVVQREENKFLQNGENFNTVKCFADLDVNGKKNLNRGLKNKQTLGALD
jgi:hypothetical protein